MDAGYYWARVDNGDWEVVEVIKRLDGINEVLRIGSDELHDTDVILEWGSKVTRGGNVVMNQYGDGCTQITNVGTLTIK